MRTLVTGATGFIGARLAERAAEAGHEVTAFGAELTPLERSRRRVLEARGLRVVTGFVEDEALLRRLAAPAELVFHLAAAQHESGAADAHYHAVNVDGTRAVLEACAEAGVQRFVHGSTIGVYGSARDGELDEASPPRPDNVYAKTKLRAEALVRDFADALPSTVVRIAETYGPGDGRLLKLFKAVGKGVFPMIGGGVNEHHPVYVDDLVDGLLLAATRPEAAGETFVLAGSEVLPTRRLVELVAEAQGRPLRSVDLPLAPFVIAAVVLETGLKLVRVAPPWHRRRLDFFVKRFSFRQEKARRVLGYAPRYRFRDGAERTAAWYREQGYL